MTKDEIINELEPFPLVVEGGFFVKFIARS